MEENLVFSSPPSSAHGLHRAARRCRQDTPAARTQRLRGRMWQDSNAACQETRSSASV